MKFVIFTTSHYWDNLKYADKYKKIGITFRKCTDGSPGYLEVPGIIELKTDYDFTNLVYDIGSPCIIDRYDGDQRRYHPTLDSEDIDYCIEIYDGYRE